jgi:nitrogen regulatory protein P-II 1
VEITIYVDDQRVEEVLRTIVDTARSGRMGDGKIMILEAGESPLAGLE